MNRHKYNFRYIPPDYHIESWHIYGIRLSSPMYVPHTPFSRDELTLNFLQVRRFRHTYAEIPASLTYPFPIWYENIPIPMRDYYRRWGSGNEATVGGIISSLYSGAGIHVSTHIYTSTNSLTFSVSLPTFIHHVSKSMQHAGAGHKQDLDIESQFLRCQARCNHQTNKTSTNYEPFHYH